MSRKDSLKIKENFSLTDNSATIGTLLDGTDFKILLYSGAIRSYMSKQYYLRIKSAQGFPLLISKANVIQVGNGANVNILLRIPIIITIQGHMFEI